MLEATLRSLTQLAALAAIGVVAVAAQDAPSPLSFAEFLDGVRTEARSRGVSDRTLDSALAGLTPEPVIVTRDRAQPEETQSLDAYIEARVSQRAIVTARNMATAHRQVLRRVERTYGIPPPLLVAVWGLESNFGRFTGTYPTIRALATLAYDGRRPRFRAELLDALAILDRGDVPLDSLRGSWAGAMGQPQFMPSSFLGHAVDFDRDGRIDIWQSLPDVFGSMANYLRNWGWLAGERWGREVSIPDDAMARIDSTIAMRTEGCRAVQQLTQAMPLAQWMDLGVRLLDGAHLPTSPENASLVRGLRRHFLVYRNYEALLGYNCSNAYAVSVGLLADRVER